MKIITIQLQEQVKNGTRLNKTVQSLKTTCKQEYLNMTNFVIYKGQKSILQEICKCNSTTKPFVKMHNNLWRKYLDIIPILIILREQIYFH